MRAKVCQDDSAKTIVLRGPLCLQRVQAHLRASQLAAASLPAALASSSLDMLIEPIESLWRHCAARSRAK